MTQLEHPGTFPLTPSNLHISSSGLNSQDTFLVLCHHIPVSPESSLRAGIMSYQISVSGLSTVLGTEEVLNQRLVN